MKTKITIGLIETNLLMRQGLISLLKNQTTIHAVFDAVCYKQVESQIESLMPDAILLGASDPQLFTTLQTLKARFPKIKVILVTEQINDQLAIKSLRGGVKAFLYKTSTYRDVIKAISEVYRKGFYYDPYVVKLVDNIIESFMSAQTISIITEREREVLGHLCAGKSSKEIAKTLHISVRTVEGHRRNLLKRTHTKNIAELKHWVNTELS